MIVKPLMENSIGRGRTISRKKTQYMDCYMLNMMMAMKDNGGEKLINDELYSVTEFKYLGSTVE